MARLSKKWKVLLAVAALAILVTTCLLLYIWYHFPVDRYVHNRIVRFLESNYHVKVEIDSVVLDLKNDRLLLRGLRINNERFPASPPPISVQEVEIRFSYNLWNRYFRIGDIFITKPNIRVLEDPNQLLNITNMFEPRNKEKSVSFSMADIGTVAIEDGTLLYLNKYIPLETRGGNFKAKLAYQPSDKLYRVELGMGGLALGDREQVLQDVKMQADFRVRNEVASFQKLHLESDVIRLDSNRASFDYHRLWYRLQGNSQVNVSRLTYDGFRKSNLHGIAQLAGIVSGVKGDFDFKGKVTTEKFQVQRIPLSGIAANIHLTAERLETHDLRGVAFGGPFQAKLALGFNPKSASQANVDISRARIETFLPALDFPFRNITGEATSQFELRWSGLDFQNSSGSGTVNYSGKLVATGGHAVGSGLPEPLPYQGSASFTKAGTRLDIERGTVATPQSRTQFPGTLTLAGDYNLKLQLQAQDGNDLVRAASLLSPEIRRQLQERQVAANATVDFQGALSGTKKDFHIIGRVSTPSMQVKQVRLSNLRASVDWTPRSLRLDQASVQFGNSTITGTVGYPFVEKGEPIQVEATIRNAAVSDLLALGNLNYPLGGVLNAQIHVSGPDIDSMTGVSKVTVDRPSIYGEPFDRLTADVEFHGKEFSVRNLQMPKGRGLVSGTISGRTDLKTATVDITGREIPLTSIQSAELRSYQLSGLLNFTLKGSGPLDNLNHTFHGEVANLIVQRERFQNLVVDATGRGQRVDFLARTSFQNNRLEARGRVLTTGDYPFSATMDLHNAPIRPYLALFRPDLGPDLGGLATGQIEAHGSMKRMESATVEARLSALQIAINRYQFRNQGEVVARYVNGIIDIKPLKLTGPDTSLNVAGQISTVGSTPVNLRLSGNANLLLLSSFIPDLTARGTVALNVYASGTMQQPKIIGSAIFEKAYLEQPDWPTPLFDTKGFLRFTANQVSIQSFSTKTRFGTINVSGGMFMDGLVPTRGRLNITGEGLRIEYPQDVKSTVDVDVDYLKSSTKQLLTGEVYIRSSEYTKDVTLADLILEVSNFRALPSARAYGRQQVNLDLDVEAYKSIRINNSVGDVVASGVFSVRGTLDDPVILGRMSVDQGKLVLQDSKYEIARGAVNFNNPRKTTPTLDFEAVTSVRDYTVTVNLRGPLDHLTTSFRSDPPLTTSDIIAMLAVGRPVEAMTAGTREKASQTLAFHGASTFLTRSLTEKLTSRSTRLFGFDRFTIDPFVFSGSSLSPRVTLGKQLSKDVAVIFATDLASTQNEVVTIEYTIREGVTLVATRTESGSFSLDVKLRKRF
ncbi:MAG TPA: translocation/assembly module TamB domain-containing protein [Acidobacteriota bacterium]|nr:translocation/assembly module TamB domain-containing protein [Acidobacteriota bacterium]